MIYGAILAGGIGKRMGYTDMPKQFLPIKNKPIIIHTIEKFLTCSKFDYIFIGVKEEWISLCQDLINKHIKFNEKIILCSGGEDRNKTIMNIINDIDNKFTINNNDIIVTHDAVRPFVSYRILKENIESALENGACDTVIKSSDTILNSNNGIYISEIPNRKFMYQGQTPQSFNIKLFMDSYNSLTENEKESLTDACKALVLKGINVHLVEGCISNIKITTLYDLKIANSIVMVNDND